MTTNNRKVRADFDKSKEYSVDVSGCTEEEKKEVQQAFFDAGIKWQIHGGEYNYTDADKYTNTTDCGVVYPFLMHGSTTEKCNMWPKEFLDLVYEPEIENNVGHIHAEAMARYAEDAKTSKTPWEMWQFKCNAGIWWNNCNDHPEWTCDTEYRRKPKTHIVHGVEIPDLRIEPKEGSKYYLADPTEVNFTYCYTHTGDVCDQAWTSRRLCYEPTEEGKQAAILHAKAMLGLS